MPLLRTDITPGEQTGDSIALLMGELERVQAMPPLEAKYSSLGWWVRVTLSLRLLNTRTVDLSLPRFSGHLI